MKTSLWLIGVFVLLTGCRHNDPQPNPTEINLTVVDESRKPIPNVEVYIGGSMGDYFSGTQKDTTLVPLNQLFTNSNGFAQYKARINPKWEVAFGLSSPFNSTGPIYDVMRLEGTVHDAVIRVGEVNNVTAIMKKL